MPLSDLAQALPGALVIGLVPGWAALTAMVPRWSWWERLAAAPGMSAGLVGVVGLLDSDLNVRFSPWHVLPAVLLLPILAALLRRRQEGRAGSASDTGPTPARRAVAAMTLTALLVGLASVATVAWAYRDQPLPVETDAPIHAYVAESAARSGTVLPVMPSPVDGGGSVRPRPGFEASATLVSWLGGPSPARSMLPLTLVAVALLPLSLVALAWAATRSWLVAMLAPLLSIGFAFPRLPVTFGEFPLVVDSTLVVAMVLAVWRTVAGERRRSAAACLAAVAAAVWAVHGLEALTAALIAAPLLATLLTRMPRRQWLEGTAVAAAASLAGAGLVTLLTRLPAVPAGHVVPGAGPTQPQVDFFLGIAGPPSEGWQVLHLLAGFDFATPVATVLFVLGAAATLLLRRHRWLTAASMLMLLCLLDIGYTVRLGRLWRAIFPWAEVDRLVSIQYFVAPLLMAIGVVTLPLLVARLGRVGVAQLTPLQTRRLALVVSAALGALAVVAVERDAGAYRDTIAGTSMTSLADVRLLAEMSRALPAGAVVLTDGDDDAGQWIDALTAQVQFAPKDYGLAHVQQDRGVTMLTDVATLAVSHACDDPAAAAAALEQVDAIYVGARERAGTHHPWTLDCIEHLPGVTALLRERWGSETAALLVVDRGRLALTSPSRAVSAR